MTATRTIRRPTYTIEPNPPNRAGVSTPGPLRYATGPHAGRPVQTRRGRINIIACARCTLPSYPGLAPLVKALGFDRKTGKAIEQYVHATCPKDVAKNRALIAKWQAADAERAAECRKLPHGGRTWSVARLFRR